MGTVEGMVVGMEEGTAVVDLVDREWRLEVDFWEGCCWVTCFSRLLVRFSYSFFLILVLTSLSYSGQCNSYANKRAVEARFPSFVAFLPTSDLGAVLSVDE
jgi:hypothetical protein